MADNDEVEHPKARAFKKTLSLSVENPTHENRSTHQVAEPEVDVLETPSQAEVEACFEDALAKQASDAFESIQLYSYAELRDSLPEGVDPLRKENHLIPQDFPSVFGLTKEEFSCLPEEEQATRKQQAGLS